MKRYLISSHTIKIILLIILIFDLVSSEFRFCYKGPQRLTEEECPGGFVANEKLSTSCAYYARTPRITTSKVTVHADVCDASAAYEIDVMTKSEDDLSSFGRDLQQINFEFDESGEPLPEDDQGGRIEEDTCFSNCLGEWVDPSLVEDESLIDDGTASYAPTAEEKNRESKTFQDLATFLLDADEEDDEDPDKLQIHPYDDLFINTIDAAFGEGPRILKLLALSMQIVVKECAPFVPEDFLRQIHRAMTWYVKKNESIITDVTSLEFNYYVGILHRCYQRRNLHFTLRPNECIPEMVDGISYTEKGTYWKYRQTGKSYRYGKHSPYVEAAWNVVEFIHGYCFESFLWDMMDLHSFTTAMEGLFTNLVMRQWLATIEVKNKAFHDAVLRVMSTDIVMRNLDACVIGGNSMAPWTKRLERPYVLEPGSSSTEIDEKFRSKPLEPGWKSGQEKYWDWYSSQGGFQEISKSFGTCVKEANEIENVEEFAEALNEVRRKQCDGSNQPQSLP